MAQLKLKGIPTIYEIPNDVAKKIEAQVADPRIRSDMTIGVDNFTFTKSSVAMVITDKQEQKDTSFTKKREDWEAYWLRQVKKSPEEKANDSVNSHFLSWWMCYTGENYTLSDMTDSVKDMAQEAIRRATDFFTEHNDRTVPDYRIWRDLFPEPVQEQHQKDMMSLTDISRKRLIDLLTHALEQDMVESEKYLMQTQGFGRALVP